jgi:hypothetical protein
MEFVCRISRDSGLDFGERNRALFKQYLKAHPGVLLKITPVLPESNKQRRYFEGALVPLIAYYQDGMDHRNADDRASVREWLKQEFNGHTVMIAGEAHKIGKSTRGRDVLNRFVEDVVAWLQDNYAPPAQALEPTSFKNWRDTVMDGPDNYIDWLVLEGVLK